MHHVVSVKNLSWKVALKDTKEFEYIVFTLKRVGIYDIKLS